LEKSSSEGKDERAIKETPTENQNRPHPELAFPKLFNDIIVLET